MKKFVATLFITAILAVSALGQSDPPPTLRIVTESPGLPSELFYGNIKVKPLRFRPCTTQPCTPVPITIADSDFFIQQQYIDFLRRFPEAAGLQYYLTDAPDSLSKCNGDPNCLIGLRGHHATNFFRSPEFQQKGSFVMYLYMTTVGQRAVTAAELNDSARVDRPHYTEFMSDLQSISDPNDDKAIVSGKKDALTVAWLARPEIQTRFGSLTNTQFVQKLESTAGVALANESTLIANLNNGTQTRAQVLRAVAESPEVDAKFYKQAFVTMQYFGFLRRDPEDCHNPANWGGSDPSQCGYIFHNNRFNLVGDQHAVEVTMVLGFIESGEYKSRF